MNILTQTLGELAREIPGASAVFHRFNLDFCCGGDQTLAEAIAARHMETRPVVEQLLYLQQEGVDRPLDHCAAMSDDRLIEHILTRYHDTHRYQLPEMIRLAARVERVHGGHPQCPAGLTAHLEQMQVELEGHMEKEEKILFPMICRGMGAMASGPMGVMRREHEEHGTALAKLNELTGQLQAPAGACTSWQTLYRGLAALQVDLKNHIHLENNILFARIDNAGVTAHG